MIANEFTRKSERCCLPFNYISRIILTEDEKRGYGTYLYFSIGHLFASLFCPPMVFFSILGVSSIADLVASQVGIRYGNRRIKWNKEKTWEGTLTATIVCFIICVFFVGFAWSFIFSIAFLVVDIVTGIGFRNLEISDNLLTPIALTFIYMSITLVFALPYETFILL
ncbi:MAG: hypothetical protein ACFE8P_12745 [Promethearchaeota archaeon]